MAPPLRRAAPWAFAVLVAAALLAAWPEGLRGEVVAGWLLVPAALLVLAVAVHRLRDADVRDEWPWGFAGVAALHLLWLALTLLVERTGCPGGPLPYDVEHRYLRYMSATRMVPLVVLLFGGGGLLAVPRWRAAGTWTLAAVLSLLAADLVATKALDCDIIH